MNGIENIIARLNSDADAEIAEMENDCVAKCESIRRQSEEDARTAYWEVMNSGAQSSAERGERARSAAGLEVKNQLLAVKQELISAAFDRAVEKLCSLPDAEYEALLARLTADAAEGGEKVAMSASDRARVGKKVVVAANRLLEERGRPAGLTLSENVRDIRGGVILENGRVETNCSFESLVEFGRSRLTGEVAGVLFD